jgi:hypothetical protein
MLTYRLTLPSLRVAARIRVNLTTFAVLRSHSKARSAFHACIMSRLWKRGGPDRLNQPRNRRGLLRAAAQLQGFWYGGGPMLKRLNSVDWRALPQPPVNGPATVPGALRSLASVETKEQALHAYNRFLYAVGNNHAGTYYPVVIATIPFLGETLTHGGMWARYAALNALIDLLGSFAPEVGYEFPAELEPSSVQAELRMAIQQISPAVLKIAAESLESLENRQLAGELVDLLAEPI